MNLKNLLLVLFVTLALLASAEARTPPRSRATATAAKPQRAARGTPMVHEFNKKVEAARAKTSAKQRAAHVEAVNKAETRRMAAKGAAAPAAQVKRANAPSTLSRNAAKAAPTPVNQPVTRNLKATPKVVKAVPARNANRAAKIVRAAGAKQSAGARRARAVPSKK